MATVSVDPHRTEGAQSAPVSRTHEFRYLWLSAGAMLSLFAVGGRWDVALAAWVAPVLLLRFARQSRTLPGLGLVWFVSFADAMWWQLQLAVPFQASTIASSVAFGTVFALPFILDRLVSERLGCVGRLLLFPSAIVMCEFLMATYSPLGTSYGIRAITQSENLSLLQVTSLTGPYGIGFLVGWLATVVNHAWEASSWREHRTAVGIYAIVLLMVVVGGSLRLAFQQPGADHVKIAGVTPSRSARDAGEQMFAGGYPISQEELEATDPTALRAAYAIVQDELFASTRQAARAGAKVVVWSETAATSLEPDTPALLSRAAAVAREEKIYLNVALGQPFSSNETHLIDPEGNILWSYRKNHPVPGLEPVPAGDTPVPTVQTPFGRLSNVICFDADFPALMQASADIMFVPGWDWPEMGRTHTLKMARLRAIENGYSLLRVGYYGYSAAFDHLGQVLATQDTTSPDRHMLFAEIPVRGTRTLYNLAGDFFAWLCVAAVAVAIGMAAVKGRRANR